MNTPTQEQKNYDVLTDGATPEEFYVDGIGGSLMGPAVTKVVLFNVAGMSATGREQRRSTRVLTIPTAALVEFCRNFLATVSTNEAVLDKGLAEIRERLIPPPSA